MPDSGPLEPHPPTLRRSLGYWQVTLYGTGSMLGAGIYALIGKAAGTLGNAVWLAFVAAMVGALFTGLTYAAIGSRYARAGGAAYAAQRAFHRDWLSYVVGIAVMMSGLTSMATGSQAIAAQVQKALDFDPAWLKPAAILVVLAIGLVIYRGIRESMWLNVLCTLVEAGGLLFIIAVGMRYWGGVNYLEIPPPAAGATAAALPLVVLQGAVLTFYSFIGFEDLLNVSEEVRNPRRTLPLGLITALGISTAIYLAVAITAVSVIPWRDLAASNAPLMEVARAAAPWLGGIDRVYLAITIFAIGNTALLNYLMGSRLLYGMSTQGLLPSALGRIHPRRHTPHVAVLALFLIVVLLIAVADIKQMAEATVLLLLFVFTIVNLALVRLRRREPAPAGAFDVPAVVPVLGALVCATLIAVRIHAAFDGDDPTTHRAPIVAGVIVIAAVILYRFLKPRNVVLEGGD